MPKHIALRKTSRLLALLFEETAQVSHHIAYGDVAIIRWLGDRLFLFRLGLGGAFLGIPQA